MSEQGATDTNVQGRRCCPKLKPEVVLTGAAKEGSSKLPADPVVVTNHDTAYICEVDLPASTDHIKVQYELSTTGKVLIEGIVTGGESSDESSAMVLNKGVRRLCPAVPFTISFCLPGPIDLKSPHEVLTSPEGRTFVFVMKADV